MYIILSLFLKNMHSHYIFYDRVFWIYFIVTLFFIILGSSSIVTSNLQSMPTILFIWTLSNIALMIISYRASVKWAPTSDNICFVDYNAECFKPSNRIWLLINVIFILLLILSVLWAGELSNTDSGPIKSMSGILIILGGIVLSSLVDSTTFFVSLFYLLIWVSLTFYTILSS